MVKKRKILFVIGYMSKGGAERVVSILANSLNRRNYFVRIIGIYGDSLDYILDDKVKFDSIACDSKIRILRPFERVAKLRDIIKNYNPSCIISFLADVNIHTLLAGYRMNYPLIVCERNDPNNDPVEKYKRKTRDWIYKYVDGAVFQTSDAMNYFKSIIPKHAIQEVIANPLSPNLPIKENYNKRPYRFIAANRLDPQKNLQLMIDSISDIIDDGFECRLDIFGEGPLREQLQLHINSLGKQDKIFLKGFTKNIHQEMKNSDCFLITSNYEGLSNSMLEALGIGLPVIATACPIGGAADWISNFNNGILVPVEDKKEIENKLRFVFDDYDKCISMGNKAKEIRTKLESEKIVDAWEKIILRVIEHRGK